MTASQLKHIRRKLGLTQEQLGERLGVTQSTIKKWELNIHPINPTAQKLIEILNGKRTRKEG